MLPIHVILHPTDFSDRSLAALPLACALARDYGARLVILHVCAPIIAYGEGILPPDPEAISREARERLDRLDIPDGIRVERQFEEGDPAELILSVAQDLDCDLIVMGTHGRTWLRRLLMGSVAEQVVRRASCPVLTVAPPARTARVPAGALAEAFAGTP